MTKTTYSCWGGYPALSQSGVAARWGEEPLPVQESGTFLPYGNGRSYGDCCLNPSGVVLDCRPLDKTLAFDAGQGILRAEAGKTLAAVLDEIVPRGWFLPVTPGTRHVTLGGAVANDVHGKNHHQAGSFGRHLHSLRLLRSDGSHVRCAPDAEPELFGATVGGLGLTGVITEVELALKPISTTRVHVLTRPFSDLAEYFDRTAAWDAAHEYTVAWIDSTARGPHLGRGLAMMANHVEADPPQLDFKMRGAAWGVPWKPPFSVLSGQVSRLFNAAYYWKGRRQAGSGDVPLLPYFYPLDAIENWNRLYGWRGFLQHQCVVPVDDALRVLSEQLRLVHEAGEGCLLAVLKRFGDRRSPGMLSFPRPGYTLALDFAFRGRRTLELLARLDRSVAEAGGAIYPAKDARLSRTLFRQFFPGWERFRDYIDPAFSSAFSERAGISVAAGKGQ